jgi:hypothetical protein
MHEVKNFFCQFPNPWTLRVSGMGCYTSKCEKNQNHCTLVYKSPHKHRSKMTHEAAVRLGRKRRGERHVNLIDEKGEKVTILVGGVNTVDRLGPGLGILPATDRPDILLNQSTSAVWRNSCLPASGMAVCNRVAGADKSGRTEVSRRRSRRRKASGLVFRHF